MQYQGVLTKMQTELQNPVQYYLVFEDDFIHVNQLLDKEIRIEFLKYQCLLLQEWWQTNFPASIRKLAVTAIFS